MKEDKIEVKNKEAIEIVKQFNKENRYRDCGKINNAIDRVMKMSEETETLKELLKKAQTDVALWKQLYKDLEEDFESYKKDKDINYLDNNHHKLLVEKSIGQIIDKPEELWFDAVEVRVIRNDILYGINIDKDFITLKEISDEHPDKCMTVIAESPLSGAIYRYNNYGNKEWQLVGTMLGYA